MYDLYLQAPTLQRSYDTSPSITMIATTTKSIPGIVPGIYISYEHSSKHNNNDNNTSKKMNNREEKYYGNIKNTRKKISWNTSKIQTKKKTFLLIHLAAGLESLELILCQVGPHGDVVHHSAACGVQLQQQSTATACRKTTRVGDGNGLSKRDERNGKKQAIRKCLIQG